MAAQGEIKLAGLIVVRNAHDLCRAIATAAPRLGIDAAVLKNGILKALSNIAAAQSFYRCGAKLGLSEAGAKKLAMDGKDLDNDSFLKLFYQAGGRVTRYCTGKAKSKAIAKVKENWEAFKLVAPEVAKELVFDLRQVPPDGDILPLLERLELEQPRSEAQAAADCSDVEKESSSESEEEVIATCPSRASRASAPKYDDCQSNDSSEFEKGSSSESEEVIAESDDEPQEKRKASSKKVQEQDVAAPTEATLASNPLVAALIEKLADERAASKEREAAAFWKGERSGMLKAAALLVLLCGCWWCEYGS